MRDTSEHIARICHKLNAKNCLAAADGNVSVLLGDNRIVITPAGVNKTDLTGAEMALMTREGETLSGKPSSERLMHLEIYRRCPAAKAVVHAHPPHAIAWSIAHPEMKELPNRCMSELILAVGSIPIVPYARPGTKDMGTVLQPYLPQSRVLILARHGALSWGETLDEAYNGIERLEHSALILKMASEIGGLSELPEAEVEALKKMRREMGDRTL